MVQNENLNVNDVQVSYGLAIKIPGWILSSTHGIETVSCLLLIVNMLPDSIVLPYTV